MTAPSTQHRRDPPRRLVRRRSQLVGVLGTDHESGLAVHLDGGDRFACLAVRHLGLDWRERATQPRRGADERDRAVGGGPGAEQPARCGGLEQRAPPGGQRGGESGVAEVAAHGVGELGPGHRDLAEHLADRVGDRVQLRGADPVLALPRGREPAPGLAVGERADPQVELVGGEQVQGAAHRPGAHQGVVGPQRRLQGSGCGAAHAGDQGGRRRDLGMQAAQPPGHGQRVRGGFHQELAPQPPARHLLPRHLHGVTSHARYPSTGDRHDLALGPDHRSRPTRAPFRTDSRTTTYRLAGGQGGLWQLKMAVPGKRAPRSGDHWPHTRSRPVGHSGSTRSSSTSPAATMSRIRSPRVRWCST